MTLIIAEEKFGLTCSETIDLAQKYRDKEIKAKTRQSNVNNNFSWMCMIKTSD